MLTRLSGYKYCFDFYCTNCLTYCSTLILTVYTVGKMADTLSILHFSKAFVDAYWNKLEMPSFGTN